MRRSLNAPPTDSTSIIMRDWILVAAGLERLFFSVYAMAFAIITSVYVWKIILLYFPHIFAYSLKTLFCREIINTKNGKKQCGIDSSSSNIKTKSENLTIQVIIVTLGKVRVSTTSVAWTSAIDSSFRETEVLSKTARLLESLTEHFVLADVLIGDWSSGKTHSFFKMLLRYLGDFIFTIIHVHCRSSLKNRKKLSKTERCVQKGEN